MTFASDANTIRAHFAAQWPLLRPSVPVAYDNAGFTPPEDNEDDPAPWVTLTILPGEGFQASLGSPKIWRNTGLIVAQIFVPVGQGDGLANALADDVAQVFRGQRVGFVTFRAPSRTRRS